MLLVNPDRFSDDRNEIASCEETAYESLPLKDAATLLFFTTQSDLLTFAQQVYLTLDLKYLYTNTLPPCSVVGK
jgi:hypothetical protein